MKRSHLRVWLVGFGTVGRWLAHALSAGLPGLGARYDIDIAVIGVANARDGFVYAADGIDLASALDIVASGRSLVELPGVVAWPTAIEGMRATEADVLVEVTTSPSTDAEPGVTHMREAAGRGIPVVTSNKWPVALHGVELAATAGHHFAFRAESTVMSGTPLLSTLREGLAGTKPVGLRGLVNATTNEILTRMHAGVSYRRALGEAQEAGLAEADPGADVEGHDGVAKLMILSALVFGRQLGIDQIARRGIAELTDVDVARAASRAMRIKHVASLEFDAAGGEGEVLAQLAPQAVPVGDVLAQVDGTANVVVYRAEPVGEITIVGPGAGVELAGQGVLSDLLAVARLSRLRA